MNQLDRNKQIENDLANDPLERIKQLEQLQIATEQKAELDKKKLLLELADRVEANKKARESQAEAIRKAEVIEYQYLAQQQDKIKGITNLLNPNETDPERKSRHIFVKQLKARREKSQGLADERKIRQDGNLYFI